jgi:hypothetical protein
VVWLGLELFLVLVTDKVVGGALVRSSFFKVTVGRLAVKERHWGKAIQGYSSGTGRVDLRHGCLACVFALFGSHTLNL